MDTGYINPANDCFDIINFPYDIIGTHGSAAIHSVVIDITAGAVVECVTASGATRILNVTTNGEQLPCFITSFTANTTVTRIRIFFNG